MARLRNRQVKATFYTDGELLRWHRDKRHTYQGIWAMAEDSGCLEDDPFEWKLTIWNSPLDADITIEALERWRDEFIAVGKLIPYRAAGKAYLFITNFHQHEHPRNPQAPDLPLPTWVTYEQQVTKTKDGREHKTNTYKVYTEHHAVRQYLGTDHDSTPDDIGNEVQHAEGSVPTRFGSRNRSPVLSSPVQPCPDLLSEGAPASGASPVENSSGATEAEGVSPDNRSLGQRLVALYVDERKALGSPPTKRQIGILAQVVGDKLAGGSTAETLQEAIRRMIRRGKPPSMLPAFVDELEAERSRAPAHPSHVPFVPDPEPTAEEREASIVAAQEAAAKIRALAAGIGGRI